MREKELRLVITFNSTTDAIAFEKHCDRNDIEGRLIPVPRAISASCGMCWRTLPSAREQIEKSISEAGLTVSGIYEVLI